MKKSGLLLAVNIVTVSTILLVESCQAWSASDILFKYQVKFKYHEEWKWWKKAHGKSYNNHQEELERHLIWLSNRKYIEQHNKNSHIFGFTLAMNYWGDMTDMEYYERHKSYMATDKELTAKFPIYEAPANLTYPDNLDWRTKGAVGSVKDQMAYQCGSSYAFGAMGALEGANALASGYFVSLSEQNILDCSVPYGNFGCSGGTVYNSFMYVIATSGVDKENSYPYRGKQSECSYSQNNRGARMSGIVRIKSGDESSLLSAVSSVGPVAVSVDASSNAFRWYSSGVFDSSRCSSSSPTHFMVVTGYGVTNGKEYWLVKNSWSQNWGLNGYILMTRGNYNQCGIATAAAYPTL